MARLVGKYAIDLSCWMVAGVLAVSLRLDLEWAALDASLFAFLLATLPVKIVALTVFGLPRQSWRNIGIPDLLRLVAAVGVVSCVLFVVHIAVGTPAVSRSIPLLDGTIAICLMCAARLAARLLDEQRRQGVPRQELRRVLIVGAGQTGTMVAREMTRFSEAGMRPVGFLDAHPRKQRQSFSGVRVLGTPAQLEAICARIPVDEVVLAMPSAGGDAIRRVIEAARRAGVRCRTVPTFQEMMSGDFSISKIREPRLEDLLRREPVRLDQAAIAGYLRDRCVLVTGAGGSIGSEVVRQCLPFKPRELVLVGRGEASLFEIGRELSAKYPEHVARLVVADVRDRQRMQHVFGLFRPDVVVHAAAHKHVPLMESNPSEAIHNNVVGTRNVAELALAYGAQHLVNISTDKAVNPSSIMGASKRVGEYIVQHVAAQVSAGRRQQFVSVRFGNVLGSRGSVVPIFMEQIERGGPVTVTHPEMRRYFMTIPEATQLVLQAGGLGQNGAVFVLDMGEPVRIVDIAHELIRFQNKEPGVDIPVVFSGPRPGEKLFEELLGAEDGTLPSPHGKIFTARGLRLPDDFARKLDVLVAAADRYDEIGIRRALAAILPTYTGRVPAPGESGESVDALASSGSGHFAVAGEDDTSVSGRRAAPVPGG